jgi:hypothetical protein
MKQVTIICELVATDEFDERDVKKMLDSSEHVREANMTVKIERILAEGGEDDGVQPTNRRF